jgi:hypothetical protein
MMTPPSCPYELFKICILCSQFYPINRPTVYEALDMLEALNEDLASGVVMKRKRKRDEKSDQAVKQEVKSVSDIQAEIAAAAAAEQASDSDGKVRRRKKTRVSDFESFLFLQDDGADSSNDGDDGGDSASDASSEAGDERLSLTNKVAQIKVE